MAGLISRARDLAAEVLTQHRPALDALAQELVAHEVVDAHRLDDLLASSGAVPSAVIG